MTKIADVDEGVIVSKDGEPQCTDRLMEPVSKYRSLTNMEFEIRPWNKGDLSSLVRHANNKQISKFMTDRFPHPYVESDGLQFINFANSTDPVGIFAIVIDGQAAGGIGIHPQTDIHRRNAEIGYWIGEPFWGRGVVSRAVALIVDFAFQHYDIDRLFAKPFGNNRASQKVLEKNGFSLEARFEKVLVKDGELLDELVYSLRRSDWLKRQVHNGGESPT